MTERQSGRLGRDLELDHAVVIADDLRDVVAGLHIILTQDEDAVGDAVRELALLGVQVASVQMESDLVL